MSTLSERFSKLANSRTPKIQTPKVNAKVVAKTLGQQVKRQAATQQRRGLKPSTVGGRVQVNQFKTGKGSIPVGKGIKKSSVDILGDACQIIRRQTQEEGHQGEKGQTNRKKEWESLSHGFRYGLRQM
jgi:hypothetical protein